MGGFTADEILTRDKPRERKYSKGPGPRVPQLKLYLKRQNAKLKKKKKLAWWLIFNLEHLEIEEVP